LCLLLLPPLLASARELAFARVAGDCKLRAARRACMRQARWPTLAGTAQSGATHVPPSACSPLAQTSQQRCGARAAAPAAAPPPAPARANVRRRASNAASAAQAAVRSARTPQARTRALYSFSSSRCRPTDSLPTRPVMRRGGGSCCRASPGGAGPRSLEPAAHSAHPKRRCNIAAPRAAAGPPPPRRAVLRAPASPCASRAQPRRGRACATRNNPRTRGVALFRGCKRGSCEWDRVPQKIRGCYVKGRSGG
jgi:hypothetical protein